MVSETSQALTWLQEHCQEFGGDSSQVCKCMCCYPNRSRIYVRFSQYVSGAAPIPELHTDCAFCLAISVQLLSASFLASSSLLDYSLSCEPYQMWPCR